MTMDIQMAIAMMLSDLQAESAGKALLNN